MSKRSTRAATAEETVRILERGHYTSPAGKSVRIAAELDASRDGSLLYTPHDLAGVVGESARVLRGSSSPHTTVFEAVNETTLHAARRLLEEENGARVLALNFASARHPGGGFLKGSQAQEESLARASGLYACISPLRAMYDANDAFGSCLYTDHMIYSPDVPVFRDDEDVLLEQPYALSFLTSPAVNAGVVRGRERDNAGRIESVMLARMEKLLAVAVRHDHDTLVLGAWGCGVFENDPEEVARWFADHLKGAGAYRTAFRKVVFAVLDRTGDGSTLRPFARHFGPPA
jgi:uncharacterized protein (TIGR02452 family)